MVAAPIQTHWLPFAESLRVILPLKRVREWSANKEVALAAASNHASLFAELFVWFQFGIRAPATIAKSVTLFCKDLRIESFPVFEHEVD